FAASKLSPWKGAPSYKLDSELCWVNPCLLLCGRIDLTTRPVYSGVRRTADKCRPQHCTYHKKNRWLHTCLEQRAHQTRCSCWDPFPNRSASRRSCPCLTRRNFVWKIRCRNSFLSLLATDETKLLYCIC